MGAVLARAAGERFRWEAWTVLVRLPGGAPSAGGVWNCGAGGGDVTMEEVLM